MGLGFLGDALRRGGEDLDDLGVLGGDEGGGAGLGAEGVGDAVGRCIMLGSCVRLKVKDERRTGRVLTEARYYRWRSVVHSLQQATVSAKA